MQYIKKMIADGYLLSSLDALAEQGVSEAALLKVKLENWEYNFKMGKIGKTAKESGVYKILFSTIELAQKSNINPNGTNPKIIESWLLDVMSQNRRRNQYVYESAQEILRKYRDAQNFYELSISDMLVRLIKLKSTIEENIKAKTENTKDTIKALLSDTVPTYEQLQEAYNLAVGRGMSDKNVERLLEARANDEEPRIQIAETIELFLSKI